jgi:CRISPR-associated endonuclease/helicase Cas3
VLERLAVIVFLHDAGKLHPGFQAKAWPTGIWKAPTAGHVREGAEIFCDQVEIARNLCLEDLIHWSVSEALLASALSHHGLPISLAELNGARWPKVPAERHYDPLVASAEMGRIMRHWFPLAFKPCEEPLPDATAFQHLFCGVVSLADWIGSDCEVFHFVAELDPEYMPKVRKLAEETIASRRIDAEAFRPLIAGRADFGVITGFETPREHQRLIGEASLDEQLVILEAETGSGKTEAALWRFIRLFEAGMVDSLYFALPTRAAAIQLHSRVNNVLKRLFGDKPLEAVLAVPGYIKAGETQGQPLPDWRVLWDDDATEVQRQARWAAESAKRYLAATVAVGTVDQAMLAGLQVKHAHLRAAALSRSLLVVDEIHASDAYMTGVLSHLLKTHLGWGGYAILMSATLGSIARAKWLGKTDEPPAFADAAATPYPAVWLKSETHPRSPAQNDIGRQKRVSMRLVESMAAEGAAAKAIAAANSGARVLVIRNTVDAAIATWQAVRDSGGEDLLLQVASGPALHHSRFAPEDRGLLDKAVEAALSPKQRRPGGVIVVGTQTLEQSLDIDADLPLYGLMSGRRFAPAHRSPAPPPA